MKKILSLILLSVACYFPIFLHLDSESLYHWDEARNALNALEMDTNGKWMVRYYQGAPETWETKPPLLIWCQLLFFKIVGYNELAIRLPSAIAAIFTIFLIVHFFLKDLKDITGGIFAALVLVCTQGYIDFHVVRTGDHDALLSFLQTALVLYAYKFLRSEPQRNKYIFLAALALLMSLLTKSIMGFAMLPGIFIYTILKKKLKSLLWKKEFWLALLGIIFFTGGYYLIREQFQPGYLQLVWENELFPRYFNTAEGHNYNKATSYWYYFRLIGQEQFTYFVWGIPLITLMLFFVKTTEIKNFGIYLFICILSFLLLISGGTTNSWYDAPVFPLLAMLTGLGLSIVLKAILNNLNLKNKWQVYLISSVFMLSIFTRPYSEIIRKVCQPDSNRDKYGTFLKQLERQGNIRELFVFYSWRNSSFLFYEKVYRDIKRWEIRSCGIRGTLKNCKDLPKANQQVMICQENHKKDFEKNYTFELIQSIGNCALYKIIITIPTPVPDGNEHESIKF